MDQELKKITLVCWHCRKETNLLASRLPSFGVEVLEAAKAAGWYGDIDFNRSRVLVFCCKEHAEAEKTKAGFYRMRPKGVTKK